MAAARVYFLLLMAVGLIVCAVVIAWIMGWNRPRR
jgi:hypothetical protein